jgi:hypothetical protein
MDNELIVTEAWIDQDNIYIRTHAGEIRMHPLSWFPRLLNASASEREDFELSPFGIHWEKLDEDLSFEDFFTYQKELVK